jgi:predicted ester cyclase
MATAKQLYQEIWKRLEHSDWDPLMSLFTQDVQIIFQDARFRGSGQLRVYLEAVMTALPDLSHEIVELIENGDGTALAGVVVARGTHVSQVPMFGKMMDLSGRQSVFQAVDLIWTRDGRVSKWWAMYDPVERAQSLRLALHAKDASTE